MRILYTLSDMHFGGTSNLLAQNLQTIVQSHSVHLVYFGPNQTMVDKFKASGIEPVHIRYKGIKHFLSVALKLREFIKENKIEIIHTNLFLDKIIVSAASLNLKVKKISTIHAAETSKYRESSKNKIIFKIENYLHNFIYHKTIAVSQATKISCLEERNINEDKITVLLNGIKPLKKAKIEFPIFNNDSDIILGTACRFHSIKGLPRLIILFSKLVKVKSNIKLLLIGDGAQRNEIDSLIKTLNLEKVVYITGFTDDVSLYLNQLDYYVNSSFSEAMPVSVLEALSLGKPVIASNVGGLTEVILDNYNGKLINFKNENEAYDDLVKFLEAHEIQYESLSLNAEHSFHNNYSSEIYCDNLNKLYSE